MYWVDINLAIEKGLKFCQTRLNAIILPETLPAYCIPKVVRMETGEVIYEEVYMSPRPPSKISLKHEWMKDLGSEHAQRSEVGQLSRSFQSKTLFPLPSHGDAVSQLRPPIQHCTEPDQDLRKLFCLSVFFPTTTATERIHGSDVSHCEL